MATNLEGCPIWGDDYPASGVFNPANRTYEMARSSRAGTGYKVDEVLLHSSVYPLSPEERLRLTTWLVDQRMQGVLRPEITEAVITYVRTRPPLPVHERADRLLRFIASRSNTVATTIDIQPDTYGAYAWSESADWDEIDYLVDYLIQMEWIRGQRSTDGSFFGGLTVDGHGRIADQEVNIDSRQAFVAMWFGESMAEAYEDGIRPAIENAGYNPLRIDQKEHINKIDDEIIAEIRRSRFVVADFTHDEGGARGGVYYEAGFAHGLELPVIFTCRKDALDTLHFDTSHYSHIVWTTPADLHKKLNTRILAVVGEGPGLRRTP